MSRGAKGGKRPAVVLLHGLGGSAADWGELSPLLAAKGYDVHAPDLPGSMKGAKLSDGYDPKSLAAWLLKTLDGAGLSEARLVGHSLGARVAGELAAREPSRVRSLVLISPLGAVGYGLADKLKWKAMSRRAIVQNAPERSMRNAVSYGFEGNGLAKRAFVERALAARTGPEGAAIALALEKCVDGVLDAPPLAMRLRGTAMPLLVVAGANDPLAPAEESEELSRARPDAVVEILSGAGHYPMLEDPGRLAALVFDFFRAG